MRSIPVRAFVAVDFDSASFVVPSLVWKVSEHIQTPNNPKFDNTTGSAETSGSISLFDIRSVEKASAMDLNSHHCEVPDNSFFVSLTGGGTFLFEAKSHMEQAILIQGLQELVAQLTLDLIIGHTTLCSQLLGTMEVDESNKTEVADTMNDMTNNLVDSLMQKC